MKKKIFIYIDSDYQVRNYFTYNSFGSLDSSGYQVVIYANDNIIQKDILNSVSNFRGYLTTNIPLRINLRRRELNILMTKYIKRSQSFRFRLMRLSRKSALIQRVYGLPVISNILLYIFRVILGENKAIRKALNSEKPDLVIIPSTIMGASFIDFLASCKKMHIKTLFIIDNWDNLSSKTVFPILPTYLAVWGQQSIEHAQRIHKFPKEKVFSLGTARFDPYFFSPDNPERIYGFDYVVFTGQSLAFDEITPLKILDDFISQSQIRNLKIVYRPHFHRGKRKCFDYFRDADFKNVILDKQMRQYYYYCKSEDYDPRKVTPSLQYYPSLLKHTLFTISPLTTMIIEAAIMKKYVLTLVYNDGYHKESPHNFLRNCEHFFGIEKVGLFKFCYKIDDLVKIFSSLLQQSRKESPDSDLLNDLNYFIESPKERYPLRLRRIVDQIVSN